jgi:methylmalonyl-CoA mutase
LADHRPDSESLRLSDDFPPVSTEAWEAAIQRDLKGASEPERLLWRTETGITVRPYYRAEDVAGLAAQTESLPGEFPFARGGEQPWQIAPDVRPHTEAVRADWLHEAGANTVQELGYALAEGVERLARWIQTRKTVDQAAEEIEFVFAAGPAFFLEIAKLRAARLLWAQAVAAFGPKEDRACQMRIHVRTSRRNKCTCDGYTNLLRATTEAVAAVIGGCDRLTVEPFGFDEHVAVNLPRILREEAHLDMPLDPGGGAYLLEVLTDALAREAWKLFQQIEREGGYTNARRSGAIDRALARSRAERGEAVARRRRTLVGVNRYPGPNEEQLESVRPPEENTPFPASRLAEPFERIRQRTQRDARFRGRYRRVLLLKRGNPRIATARANFARDLFGCAGFEIEEAETLPGTGADLIVLCAPDSESLSLAREVCPQVRVPVLAVRDSADQPEALLAAGVHGTVHSSVDAVQILVEWQDRLGMKE